MAGDPFRDACRQKLDQIIAASSIAWAQADTVNTKEDPDLSVGRLELEFSGATESLYHRGGDIKCYREIGRFAVHVIAPLGKDRDTAESYGQLIRAAFRSPTHRRFATADSRYVQITNVSPLSGGQQEGGSWKETVFLQYEVFNYGN